MICCAASALPSDFRTMRRISSSASKTFSKPSRMWTRVLQRLELVLEPPGHHLQPEVEEVPQHRVQIEPLGPADVGGLGWNQARQVDDEAGLQRRVLEEVRHDHLLVGVLLQLDGNPHVLGREVLDVQQAAAACG